MGKALPMQAEPWFAARGIPQVLPLRVRARFLLVRLAPLLFAVTVLECLVLVSARALEPVLGEAQDAGPEVALTAGQFVALLALFASPLLAALAWWSVRRVLRVARVSALAGPPPGRAARAAALVIALVWPAVPRILAHAFAMTEATVGWPTRLACLAALCVLVGAGAGAFLTWSLRRAVVHLHDVGTMLVRVLPVLMLTVLFFFFNAEIWQVATALEGSRAIALGGFLLACALVVIVVTTLDEMRAVFAAAEREPDASRRRQLLAGTPFATDADVPAATDADVPAATDAGASERAPLRRGEWVNFLLVPIAAQVLQVALFVAVMGLFFVAFGALAVPDSVAKAWSGADPQPVDLLGLALPLSGVHAKVCLVLACFCGLSFAASSSADAGYRRSFLEPILAENEVYLAARTPTARAWATRAGLTPLPGATRPAARPPIPLGDR